MAHLSTRIGMAGWGEWCTMKYAIVYREKCLAEETGRHPRRGAANVPGWVLDIIPENRLAGMTTKKLLAKQKNWRALRDVELAEDAFRAVRSRKKRVEPGTKTLTDLPEYDDQGARLWRQGSGRALKLDDVQFQEVRELASLLGWDYDRLSYDEKEAFVQEWQANQTLHMDGVERLRAMPVIEREALKRIIVPKLGRAP